jgi:hypothetical protein
MYLAYHTRLVGINRSDGVESFKTGTLSLPSLLNVPPVCAMNTHGGGVTGVKLRPH